METYNMHDSSVWSLHADPEASTFDTFFSGGRDKVHRPTANDIISLRAFTYIC